MYELLAKSTENDISLSVDNICDRVLGIRFDCTKSLGYSLKPSSVKYDIYAKIP